MKIRQYLFWSLVIFGFFGLGFVRDVFFVQANYWLGYKHSQNTDYINYLKYPFLFDRWSYYTLYYAKFIFTLVFSVIYLIWSLFPIWFVFRSKTYLIWSSWLYLGVFMLSVLTYLSGYIVFNVYETYAFSRFLAGIIQSPMAFMLLFMAFYLHHQNSLKELK